MRRWCRADGIEVVALAAILIVMVSAGTAATLTPAAPAQSGPTDQSHSISDHLPTDKQPEANPASQSALIYSPWAKVCKTGKEPSAKVCFTTANGRLDSGMVAVTVMLIEAEGGTNFLRIILPLGMQLPAGTQLTIDQDAPITAPYILCDNNGCMSDYPATSSLIEQLKKGQRLIVQAVERQGQTISFLLQLADFAIAYDGVSIDARLFEEQQKKLADYLRKSASKKSKDQNFHNPKQAGH